MKTVNILGAPVASVTLDEAAQLVNWFVKEGRPRQVVTLNPEYLYRAQVERQLMDIVRQADLVTADGVGIVWAARKAGHTVPERVTGIDLLLRLAQEAGVNGWRVFLLGSAPGVAEAAGRELERRHPGLVLAGTHHGYFKSEEDEDVVAKIREARPDLLFIALGAPKQEIWGARYLGELDVPVVMGVGGSLDVLAGTVRRAPVWTQRLHIEWLARLVMDPKRWRRQLVLPKFALLVLLKGSNLKN
ncbi:MAG: glycosyltransferase [Desulforudis sp.]|jgi:N-acetylglucosaminyldiphosphoundecaprenol N-acetyl-beta-D-mannosaminyltransferase|nr:WecB/TagA/CpsF family glycosyltransferase [Clostridia bacterium]RJX20327.1 MAG: glycosyltransferase [Desulforudis sp.]